MHKLAQSCSVISIIFIVAAITSHCAVLQYDEVTHAKSIFLKSILRRRCKFFCSSYFDLLYMCIRLKHPYTVREARYFTARGAVAIISSVPYESLPLYIPLIWLTFIVHFGVRLTSTIPKYR